MTHCKTTVEKARDLPDFWTCERCAVVVPMDDTCIVPNTPEIICQDCDEARQEREAAHWRADAAFSDQ